MIEERDGGCGLVLRPDGLSSPAVSVCRISGGFDGAVAAALLWHGVAVPRDIAAATRERQRRPPALTPRPPDVDAGAFREAMSRFPSGVTIVTTRDRLGRPWGFTASAFTALSADPPLVLVCLDNGARCHAAFVAAERFAVAILGLRHRDIAWRFASKDADKFGGGEFAADEYGSPCLPDAVASLSCATHARFPGGDHTIIVGRVLAARAQDEEPAVYAGRKFRVLGASP